MRADSVPPPSGAARAQALGTWRDLQLRLAGRAAPLAPLATCAAVEEAALALPLLVQASADSLDDLAACSGDGATRSGGGEPRDAAHVHAEAAPAGDGGAGRGAAWEREAGPVQRELDGIAARVEAAAPVGLFQQRAASGGALAAQLAHLHGVRGHPPQPGRRCAAGRRLLSRSAGSGSAQLASGGVLGAGQQQSCCRGVARGGARRARGSRGARARGPARAGPA